MEMMDTIARWLTQDWVIVLFVLIVLAVAVIPIYQAIASIRKVNTVLTAAINALRNTDQQQFKNKYENIKGSIEALPLLKHVWGEFIETTYWEKDNNKKPVKLHLSRRPCHYFNRDAVLGTQLNLAQFLAWPNYIVGVGLTLTFIGLAAALHVAQAGLTSGGGQQALQELLKVASVKFISSITAIFCSILVSFLQRIRLKNFQKKLDKFCTLLEERTQYTSAEQLLHAQLTEQKAQTFALTEMAGRIAEGITDAMGKQLPASVAHALEPLAQEIRGLAQKFSGSNESALDKVLQEFIAQLRQSSADDMQGMVQSVKTLKDSLDGLVVSMADMGKNFGADTKESTGRLASMLETFVTSFAPVSAGIGQFGKTLTTLENIAGQIEHAGNSISGAATLSNTSLGNLSTTVNAMSDNFATMNTLLATFSAAITSVDYTAGQLKSAGGSIATAADTFKSSAQAIEQAEGNFVQKINSFQSVTNSLSGTAGALERASDQVNNAAQPLAAMATGLSGALQTIQETETRLQNTQREITTMVQDLQQFTTTIPTLWTQYESRFKDVDADLGKAFTSLANGSEQFSASLSKFMQDVDASFSTAIQGLSGAIQELTNEREATTVART